MVTFIFCVLGGLILFLAGVIENLRYRVKALEKDAKR